MTTTGISLINKSSKTVEFHVLPQGTHAIQRHVLKPNTQIKVSTDSAVASHDVRVTIDARVSATLTSKHLNTTFTVTDDLFSASEPFSGQRQPMPDDACAAATAQIEALRATKDIPALAAMASAAIADWYGADGADAAGPYVLHEICTQLASFDLGDWPAQEALVQQCAVAALSRNERLSELEEVAFALRLTEPAATGGRPIALALPQRTGFWLRAWSRLKGAIDPAFDPAHRPLLNVAPPAPTGFSPGIAPDAIDDPALRAEYAQAIDENRHAAAHYRTQIQLRQADARMYAALQQYLFRAYTSPRFYVDALETLLAAHLPHTGELARLADILDPIKSTVAKSQPAVQPLPTLELRASPRDNFAGRSHTQWGIGEEIDLSVVVSGGVAGEPVSGVVWHVKTGDASMLSNDGNGHAMLRMGATPGTVCLTATSFCGPLPHPVVGQLELIAVAPTSATMGQLPGTAISHTHNTWSVGFTGRITVAPGNVSYANVLFREGYAVATATGWLSPSNGDKHAIGSSHTITGTVVDCVDNVASGGGSAPYSAGDFNWPIPWEASLDNGKTWVQFTTANHHATSSAAGQATISKAGAGPFSKNLADPTS